MNRLQVLSFSIVTVMLILMTTGCQSAKPAPAQPATVVNNEVTSQDSLTAWLAEAPAPEQVKCSVPRDVAPEAVDCFTTISKAVASIYGAVYNEAKETAEVRSSNDVTADAVLAKVAAGVTTTDPSWKTIAQEAVVANYQSTLKAIDEQSKSLAEYTGSLKSDVSIASLTNNIEKTSVLIKIGKDTASLGRQLKRAGEGASAIRMRRMSTALGK